MENSGVWMVMMVVMGGAVGGEAEGTLCQACACYPGGVVNCASRDLQHVPLITNDDVSDLGYHGLVSFKDNPDLRENAERLLDYYPHIQVFEFDRGCAVCEEVLKLAAAWPPSVKIYGCPRTREVVWSLGLSVTTDTIEGKKLMHVEFTNPAAMEVKNLKKSWLVNTVFGWIGLIVSGLVTSILVRWYIQRRGDGQVGRIRALLRRYYGRRRLQEFGINPRVPADVRVEIPGRRQLREEDLYPQPQPEIQEEEEEEGDEVLQGPQPAVALQPMP